jgi:transposase
MWSLAYVDQGYTGEAAESVAAKHGIRLELVKHTQAKRGFVLLPRRWVVERSFAWAVRFRPLARDYERLSQTLAAGVREINCYGVAIDGVLLVFLFHKGFLFGFGLGLRDIRVVLRRL